MLRSMYSGIGGMKNFQTKLDVIGNNIANVNTYGFKKGRVTFKDIASQTISGASSAQANRGGTNAKQIGLGSALGTIDTIMTNSSLQTTGRPLDLGIDGDGFLIVKNGNQQLYTRAGNLDIDSVGNLVNGDGLKVQGYGMNANGTPNTSKLVNLTINKNATVPPSQTSFVKYAGNLDSNAVVGATASMDFNIKDSLGNDVPITAKFTKDAATNSWTVNYTTTSPNFTITANTGNITFNNNGTLNTAPVNTITLTANAGYGGIVQPIAPASLDYSGISQNAAPSSLSVADKDGYSAGSLSSYTIGQSGEISGVFSNGQVKTLGQLALATFSNPGGLIKAGSNTFQDSNNSGIANVSTPGNSRGVINSGSLEMSNVDLSEEFTDMIVAQRGFQANSRIITTSDQILEELVNLKR
ncbi:flagellar hook protein FlgE [Bacillus sp. RG28]|uniref:Flagellar hook protein FlgE n=1 Tax=Gottfriedia endophytica TaxID=2820819 RepID=A0A940NJ00_9BACI|nr:flagellar hook protein FlgE [Gottfriedia endophytica]MBP0726234.1 flagellar hook protein FlgE [Gottfriedia endophytica]